MDTATIEEPRIHDLRLIRDGNGMYVLQRYGQFGSHWRWETVAKRVTRRGGIRMLRRVVRAAERARLRDECVEVVEVARP